jgi:hypothetical protein
MSEEIENRINKLKKTIPFKWRIQSEIKNKLQVRMIAYVDARDVAEQLDKVVSPENWTDTYKDVKGVLFCSIGININGNWVYKSDCGVASRTEKEKGESSDAFKRAAVKWGINRDAYKVGMLDIPAKEFSGKKYPCDSTGKFLKGQALYDYCNDLAKISELENYDIDLSDGDEVTEHTKMQELFELKQDYIPANDFYGVKKVIDDKKLKSYPSTKAYLENIVIPE